MLAFAAMLALILKIYCAHSGNRSKRAVAVSTGIDYFEMSYVERVVHLNSFYMQIVIAEQSGVLPTVMAFGVLSVLS